MRRNMSVIALLGLVTGLVSLSYCFHETLRAVIHREPHVYESWHIDSQADVSQEHSVLSSLIHTTQTQLNSVQNVNTTGPVKCIWDNMPTLTQPERRAQMRHLVLYFTRLFASANITHYLHGGNLLSLIRNNSFTLPNDDDVDVCVVGTDVHKVIALQERVKNDGHALVIGPFAGWATHPQRIAKAFFHHFERNAVCYPAARNGCYGMSSPVHMDIFFMDKVSFKGVQYLKSRDEPLSLKARQFPKRYRKGISLGRIMNQPVSMLLPPQQKCVDDGANASVLCVSIPAKPHDYLKRLYGRDWGVPVPINKFKGQGHIGCCEVGCYLKGDKVGTACRPDEFCNLNKCIRRGNHTPGTVEHTCSHGRSWL